MQDAYIQVIVTLHAAFAAVFFFLDRQRPTRFARLFASAWIIEGCRAAILLPVIHGYGGLHEQWFCLSDVLCFFANACLLTGCADIAGAKLPQWLGRVYFCSGIPLVIFNRFVLPSLLHSRFGIPMDAATFDGVFANMVVIFVPVGISRLTIVGWLFRIWRRTHLPGALVATSFSFPYAVLAFAVPLEFYFSYQGQGSTIMWFIRVLGFSIGLVMLILDLQQTAVKKSEASLAAAQALAKLGSWEQDVATRRGTWSAEMFRLYSRNPALGPMTYEEFLATIHPEDCEKFIRNESEAIAQRRSSWHEFRIVRPDGSLRWIQGQNTPIYDANGTLMRLVGTEQDVTERKRAESFVELQHAVTRELAQGRLLEPTLRKIIEMLGRGLGADFGALWILDRSIQVLRCSETWPGGVERFSEFAEATQSLSFAIGEGFPGRVFAARIPLVVRETAMETSFSRKAEAIRAGLHGAVGFPIVMRDEVLGVVEFYHQRQREPDPEVAAVLSGLGAQIGQFLDRLRLEEQHRQSQKLEAVGTLAGGIAHDFNNILTAITGYTELAKLEAAANPLVTDHLNSVHTGARRAAELVRQILAFSRRQDQQRLSIDLRQITTEALALLRATIPTTVEINYTCDESILPVLADATSIHQVIVNLGTNGWHAMKDQPGVLEIRLSNFDCSTEFARTHPGLNAGRYVRLSVSDTGHGMEPAVVARIFEPFFTTKAPGEGTGLGLSVVHGIVQSHDGAIFVSTQPGEGTIFYLYLPVHSETPEAPAGAALDAPNGSGERILLVDDEATLARMAQQILERLGYVVETHQDAAAALDAFLGNPTAYDLLVTDLTMPGLTGIELARQVLKFRPGLPIVLMSGYASTLTAERLQVLGIDTFLLKPHSMFSLATATHQALSRSREAQRI
jgi:PAS domain S-box-containing protein